jgi:decaprenyl-phosphate phosphoribosyltransferase
VAQGQRPLSAILKLLRPKQWLKNVLVFAAPGAADVLLHSRQFAQTMGALVAVCFAARAVYCFNDASDAEADRKHPTKRTRPVASGAVSPTAARIIGATLITAALILSFVIRLELGYTVAAYLVLQVSYTYYLKHVAVLDIVAIAGGFVLRAVAGAAAVDVPISNWFFIVTMFASLFMATGKRSAEFEGAIGRNGETRKVLESYTKEFLTFVRAVSAGVALVAYCVWAFERAAIKHPDYPWFQVSIFPFTIAFLRYALALEHGQGEAPEDVVTGDLTLLVMSAIWAATFGLGIVLAK